MKFDRYAIYFTPQGSLAEAGAAWLGWDLARGRTVAHPDVAGLDVAALTETPRKYGLHATIKPPFVLAEGASADGLQAAFEVLCTRLAPVTLDGLALTPLGRFLALTPEGDTAALNAMAAEVVRGLDMFRAPPTEADLARRRQANLTPAQEANLIQWGYPYVMDAFRFHITLTSKLPKADLPQVTAALDPYITPHLPQPFVLSSLTLVGQAKDGMFHEVHRAALSG
jgi:putative phosphonate metabolism protein